MEGWAKETLCDTVAPGKSPSCVPIIRVRALHWEAPAYVPHPITDTTTFIKLGKLGGLRGEKQELLTTPKQDRKAEGRGLIQSREKKKKGGGEALTAEEAMTIIRCSLASSLNRVRNTQPNFQQRYGRLLRHKTAGIMGDAYGNCNLRMFPGGEERGSPSCVSW